jgi:hypothetical protein
MSTPSTGSSGSPQTWQAARTLVAVVRVCECAALYRAAAHSHDCGSPVAILLLGPQVDVRDDLLWLEHHAVVVGAHSGYLGLFDYVGDVV